MGFWSNLFLKGCFKRLLDKMVKIDEMDKMATMFNNCFLISFLIIIICNLLNFKTHQCNVAPCFFDYTCSLPLCNLEIKNGSFHYKEFHIHHWIIGILILVVLVFFDNSCIKSCLQGIASAAFVDGLLFEDRFRFRF